MKVEWSSCCNRPKTNIKFGEVFPSFPSWFIFVFIFNMGEGCEGEDFSWNTELSWGLCTLLLLFACFLFPPSPPLGIAFFKSSFLCSQASSVLQAAVSSVLPVSCRQPCACGAARSPSALWALGWIEADPPNSHVLKADVFQGVLLGWAPTAPTVPESVEQFTVPFLKSAAACTWQWYCLRCCQMCVFLRELLCLQ